MPRRRQHRRPPCALRSRFTPKQRETTRCVESVSAGQNMFGPVRAMGAQRSQRRDELSFGHVSRLERGAGKVSV